MALLKMFDGGMMLQSRQERKAYNVNGTISKKYEDHFYGFYCSYAAVSTIIGPERTG